MALTDFLVRIRLRGQANSAVARAAWLHRWGSAFARLLHLDIQVTGTRPTHGLLVSNHLSYVDIVTLTAVQPLAFVSKSEVRDWPVIGWLTRCAGTLYIRRDQRADVHRLAPTFKPIIDQGIVVTLFPEGTSSDGSKVLPFRSSLMEPAVEHGWPVTPMWIGYRLATGSVADEVCYWRDMTFGPHFLNLLSLPRIEAQIAFGEPVIGAKDRKELTSELHRRVTALAEARDSTGLKTVVKSA